MKLNLMCLRNPEKLNSRFSASYTEMTITFDVLNRFEENKVLQTAQTMENMLRSNTNITIQTVTF